MKIVKKETYKSFLKDALDSAFSWKMAAASMMLSNLLLAYFVVTADTSEKTVITPATIEKTFWVKGDEVSPEYIEQMAKHFSALLLTYHVKNADYRFDEVLRYTHPSFYQSFKSRLGIDAERIKRNELGSVFHQMGIQIKKDRAIINGQLIGMIGQQVVSQRQKYYEIKFNYESGSLYVAGFTELEKSESGELRAVKSYDEVLVHDPVFDRKADGLSSGGQL